MKTTIRPMGNSQGVLIPKPLLAQVGLVAEVEMTIERDALVLRKPAKAVRRGWSEDARRLAQADDDALVLGEFANSLDAKLKW